MDALKRFTSRLTLRGEQGQYLVYTALALPMVILLVGLVVDGGLLFAAYRRTVHTASLSAQAASHAIDANHFQRTNQVQLDPLRARQVAVSYAALNSDGQVRVTGLRISGQQVLVQAEARVPLIFMRIFGFREFIVSAQAVAVPRFGIEAVGQ